MARELVAWCDVHLAEDERVTGVPVLIALGGGAPVQLDLCVEHELALVGPLRKVVEEFGVVGTATPERPVRPTDRRQSERQPATCPACGTLFKLKSSLRGHTVDVHGMTLAQLSGIADFPCPEDGCPRAYGSIQGVSMHLYREHEWSKERRARYRSDTAVARHGAVPSDG